MRMDYFPFILLSLMVVAFTAGHEIHANEISARSPVRQAQAGTNIAESGRTFGFQGHEGAAILQGVGENMRARQHSTQQMADYLGTQMKKAHGNWWDLKTRQPKADQRQREYEEQQQEAWWTNYRSTQEHKVKVDKSVKLQGENIKSIGLVNKDMHKRMMANFQPVPNSDPKTIAALKKAQGVRKKEERARKKDDRARRKEETMLKRGAKARAKEGRARKKQQNDRKGLKKSPERKRPAAKSNGELGKGKRKRQ